MQIAEFYHKNHRKLLLIPLAMVVIALVLIFVQYQKTGDIALKDVSLSGGITATVYSDKVVDVEDLEAYLNKNVGESSVRVLSEFGSSKPLGLIVETADLDDKLLESELEKYLGFELTQDNLSMEIVGSGLGQSFYRQMLIAILFSFILMAVVVFVTYRTVIPSLAVVFAAFMDIIVTLAIVNLIGIKLSAAGISAFLLLIGYSIDTDILQTTRVLKRKEGTPFDRMKSSVKTGLTMTLAAIVALTAGYFISTSFVMKEMFSIIIIGLLVDIIATYLMNSSILLSYAEKRSL
ncbi:MAG TPA: hypothetical protein VJC07_03850 [Candidatus Nanoarchaeia archaeon]|nr:hypothetical protein [Candidatus Nanoarchaeia archaeon]